MDKRFFDTNVLLDVLERRDPWFPEAVECLGLARAGRCVGAVSAIALSDIAYIQRATDTAKIYAAFEQLVGFLDIATLGAGQGASVPHAWIAERLNLKSAANASQQVRRFQREPEKLLPKEAKLWKLSRNGA